MSTPTFGPAVLVPSSSRISIHSAQILQCLLNIKLISLFGQLSNIKLGLGVDLPFDFPQL